MINDRFLEEEHKVLDPDLHVLLGYDLRSFLNSKLITPGNISSLLKGCGVYVPTKNENTIPLLSSLILSPEIFHQMLSFVSNKEQRPKYRTGSIELSENGKILWKDNLQDSLEYLESLNIKDNYDNVEYEKCLILEINGSVALLSYELRRNDYNQDLLKRDLIVKGSLQFSDKKDRLEVVSIYSSKETEEWNKILIDSINRKFFTDGITSQEEIDQIEFKSFTNEERIRFFNRLVAGNTYLKNGSLETLAIMLDPDKVGSLPNDPEIEFFKGNLEGLKTLGGKSLSESFFIKKDEYYPYYFIPTIEVKYDFLDGANKGFCIVEFFFKAIKKNYLESVLDVSLKELKYEEGGISSSVRRKVELKLNQEIQAMIESNYTKNK